jgi:hypothetical protein
MKAGDFCVSAALTFILQILRVKFSFFREMLEYFTSVA